MNQAMALMDWDNTLRPGFTILDWSRFLATRGLFDKQIAQEMSATIQRYREGTLTYRELSEGAPRLYGLGLQGSSVQAVTDHAAEFAEKDMPSLFSFVGPLHQFLRQRRIISIVISGAPVEVLEAYKNILGWRDVFGVSVAVSNGKYLATLVSNPAGAGAKEEIVSRLQLGRKALIAFGDSEADIPLLRAASWKVVIDNEDLAADMSNTIHVESTANSNVLMDNLESSFSSGVI